MEIRPAPFPNVQRGRRGRVVFVDDDALGIAKELEGIQLPEGYGSLRLGWNEFGEYFVVIQVMPNGEERLVTIWDPSLNGTPDYRLIQRVRKVIHPSYDIARELDKIDEQAKREADYSFSQKLQAKAEFVAHAVRKDIGAKNKIYVPGRDR